MIFRGYFVHTKPHQFSYLIYWSPSCMHGIAHTELPMQVDRVHQVPPGHIAGLNVTHGGADPTQLHGWKEGVGEVPPSTRVQERADRTMALYSGGHLLVLKDANRIVRNLSVNSTKPLIQHFEVRLLSLV